MVISTKEKDNKAGNELENIKEKDQGISYWESDIWVKTWKNNGVSHGNIKWKNNLGRKLASTKDLR